MKPWIVALSALVFFTLAPPSQGETKGDLLTIGSFAVGGVGVAGTMSGGERALRELLDQPDAVARLEALVSSASPAGKLYGLLGLRIRDRTAYERALDKCRNIDAKVQTARGCILGHESFRHLLEEIERGQYDSFLERKFPH